MKSDLIPTEHFQFRILDSLCASLSSLFKKVGNTIYIPGLGNCIPTRSARSAIAVAVKALNLPPGSKIGVPLYCCPVVFKAVKESGYNIEFIDVDYSTYCISNEDLERKRSLVSAVIAVHMFGNICEMQQLLKISNGIPVIEDCAQALGSRYKNQLAGTFGTISAFSFRSGKYISAGEGGALYSNDKQYISLLSKLVANMPEPGWGQEIKHSTETCMRSALRTQPLYGLVGYKMWQVYNRSFNYTDKSPIVHTQTFKSDYYITTKRLETLSSEIKAQRDNSEYYFQKLSLEPGMLCNEPTGVFYNRYLFPLLCPSQNSRDFLAEYIYCRNVGAIQPYKDIIDIARTYYGYESGCPNAEQIAQRVLVIPNNFILKKTDLEHVSHSLNEGWKEYKERIAK